jgi:hypothetical protein
MSQITVCPKCHKLYETTTEAANEPLTIQQTVCIW